MAELRYGSLPRRAAANLVDNATLLVIDVVLYLALRALYLPAALAVWVLYFSVLESSPWQGTLGGHLMGLAVTDMRGNRISFRRALSRASGMVLSALLLYLGYLMAFFNPRHQTLHDWLAGTVVLKAQDK